MQCTAEFARSFFHIPLFGEGLIFFVDSNFSSCTIVRFTGRQLNLFSPLDGMRLCTNPFFTMSGLLCRCFFLKGASGFFIARKATMVRFSFFCFFLCFGVFLVSNDH